jgi:polysaccharide pyruvyl transferase WcaK-like protein
MDELNDLEMGKLLAACDLTVGTRLHSAIISMNFGTPAIAINYEHKSAGIMQQLGMPEMAVDIRHCWMARWRRWRLTRSDNCLPQRTPGRGGGGRARKAR